MGRIKHNVSRTNRRRDTKSPLRLLVQRATRSAARRAAKTVHFA